MNGSYRSIGESKIKVDSPPIFGCSINRGFSNQLE